MQVMKGKEFLINKDIKKNIAYKSVDFLNTDDLLLLAEAYVQAENILRENDFPIEDYKIWLDKESAS